MFVVVDLSAILLDGGFAETDAAIAGGISRGDFFRDFLAGVWPQLLFHLAANFAGFFQGLLLAAVGGIGEEFVEALAAPVNADFPSSDRAAALRVFVFDAGDVLVWVH